MENGFDIAKNTPTFKKIEVSSLMFSEYRCMSEESVFTSWSHVNYFIYVLEGKKKWQTLDNNYMVHAGEVIFVKKGAKIATIGNAGGQYYAHLHFEIRENVELPIGPGYAIETKGYLNPTIFIKKNR